MVSKFTETTGPVLVCDQFAYWIREAGIVLGYAQAFGQTATRLSPALWAPP